jgi:hypothetical protein
LWFPPSSSPPAPAGIDIVSSRKKEICDETLEEIRVALAKFEGEDEEVGKAEIFLVHSDGDRDAEMKAKSDARHQAWKKRSGPKEGISPDLVYDYVDPRRGSKCIVQ